MSCVMGLPPAEPRRLAWSGGRLLVHHFKDSYDIVRAQYPAAPIYTWSDMFDPNHNAVDKYYLWDSTIAESWKSAPADVIVFNWNLSHLTASLTHFAIRGNRQCRRFSGLTSRTF